MVEENVWDDTSALVPKVPYLDKYALHLVRLYSGKPGVPPWLAGLCKH
jgi:hypothetical protein